MLECGPFGFMQLGSFGIAESGFECLGMMAELDQSQALPFARGDVRQHAIGEAIDEHEGVIGQVSEYLLCLNQVFCGRSWIVAGQLHVVRRKALCAQTQQ